MDYSQYEFSKSEYLFYGIQSGFVVIGISYLMYKSILVSLICLPLIVPLMKYHRKECIKKQKNRLLHEFREFLYSLIVCLGSGYSIGNSLPHIIKELEMLYSSEAFIISEIKEVHRRISLGASVEEAFEQFSERTDCPAIELFLASLTIGVHQGGNLIEVLRENSNMIIDQVSIHQEIDVITAEKQFELKFLSCFPFFVVAMLNFSSPEFMETLYTTISGRIGMTVAMGMIAAGILLGRNLVESHT
jgi:tight adherence protein B